MAQLGFHGLIGVRAAASLRRIPGLPPGHADAARARGAFAFGLVLGNLLPDADFFLLGPIYLINSQLAMVFHRTFTHSLLAVVAVIGYYAWRARRTGRADLAPFGWGLGLGVLIHAVTDMLVWFSAVDFFWPLSRLGLAGQVNFWARYEPPGVVSALLGAADYLAFGLYYVVLGRLARRFGTNREFLPTLGRVTVLQWVVLAVYVPLAFVLPLGIFNIAHYALFILAFLPLVLWVTYRMRPTLERLSPAAPEAAPAEGAPARASS